MNETLRDVGSREIERIAPVRKKVSTGSLRELIVLIPVVVTAVVLSVLSPYFLTGNNLGALAIGMVPDAVIAVGMTFLMISGGFDLSVGSVMALAGVAVSWLLLQGVPPVIAGVCGVFVGVGTGAVNGLMVTRAKVNPLIATLAMMWIARGVSLAITQGSPMSNLPDSFAILGQGYVLNTVPVSVIVMLVTVVGADLIARKTVVARQAYYVGGNEKAALLSGIRVERVRLACYMLSGALAAFAGLILTSRLMSATPTAGNGMELRAISATVIGGATLAGGEGTVLGTFMGVIFMALVQNALTLLDVSLYWHGAIMGAILAIAVTLDMLSKRKRP